MNYRHQAELGSGFAASGSFGLFQTNGFQTLQRPIENNPGGREVTRQNTPAAFALVRPLTQGLLSDRPAARARLGRLQLAGRRFHSDRTSFRRFVLENGFILTWCGVQDLPVQPCLPGNQPARFLDRPLGGHVPDRQAFRRDQREPANHLGGKFVMPVQTAAGGSGAGFRQSPYGLLPPVGAPLPARHGALKAGDLLPLRLKPAGIFDLLFDRLAVLVGDGERQERLDAPVRGASICAALPNDLQALQGERQIPRSAAVQQFAGLDRAAVVAPDRAP
jgi:hypothetical protein